jgi:hypothetical protein
MVSRELRISDADRNAVARQLARALREGRLTLDEFDERSRDAYAARTRGDLDDVVRDLPPDLW